MNHSQQDEHSNNLFGSVYEDRNDEINIELYETHNQEFSTMQELQLGIQRLNISKTSNTRGKKTKKLALKKTKSDKVKYQDEEEARNIYVGNTKFQ